MGVRYLGHITSEVAKVLTLFSSMSGKVYKNSEVDANCRGLHVM